jgi:hypothetical protein
LYRAIPRREEQLRELMFRPLPKWFQILNLSDLAEALKNVHHFKAEMAPEDLEWKDVEMTDA